MDRILKREKNIMKTNLEKWKYYLSIITDKTNNFIDSQKEGKIIPEKYYIIKYNGQISEKSIINVEYSHYKHDMEIELRGKNPTKKDITRIIEYSTKEIPFVIDNIYFKSTEIYDKQTGNFSSSHIGFLDIINKEGIFYSLEEAQIESEKIIEKNRLEKQFKQEHHKDTNYNYAANGYKFLGWQNSWKYEYYDGDGNLCSETGKPRKYHTYPKEIYSEYMNCVDSKHLRIEVSHSNRGVENTVSCPICKIYWKYDCSG